MDQDQIITNRILRKMCHMSRALKKMPLLSYLIDESWPQVSGSHHLCQLLKVPCRNADYQAPPSDL